MSSISNRRKCGWQFGKNAKKEEEKVVKFRNNYYNKGDIVSKNCETGMHAMKNKKFVWNLNKQFLTLTILPIICLGLVIMFVAYFLFDHSLMAQVSEELQNATSAALIHYDMLYPGDYSLKRGTTANGKTTYDLVKGDAVITQEYTFLDRLKEATGIDVSIFYQDTRILTTICNALNQRFVGTSAHPLILEDVLIGGEAHFYHKAIINEVPYFAYYAPLCNSNGEIVGMVFAGKPSEEINRIITRAMVPIVLVSLLASLLAGAVTIAFSRKVVFAIRRINTFLSRVAQGTLNMDLDSRILTRKDELGDMGRNAVNMQRSLRALVEQDALTGLNNRRYADKQLHHLIAQNHSAADCFTIAIGDIDFFKKVNDTYGHEAGDVVLKGVSELIRKHMKDCGYAARWGGEEFLFVFEDLSYKRSVEKLQQFLDELRETTFLYKDTPIQVTMTLGVAICNFNDNLNILLKTADDKLYKGKLEGRNRIVT